MRWLKLFIFSFLIVLSSQKDCGSDIVSPDTIDQDSLNQNQYEFVKEANETLDEGTQRKLNKHKARNVIIVLGSDINLALKRSFRQNIDIISQTDPSVVYNWNLFMKYFKDLGLVLTSCADSFDPDEACATSVLMTGVLGNLGTVALSKNIKYGERKQTEKCIKNALESFFKHAQQSKKRTGFVTTSLVTGPEVSSSYGQTSDFEWQSDRDMINNGYYAPGLDLATQMILNMTGHLMNVKMGGGGKKFFPKNCKDGEECGERLDGVNLVELWKALKCEDDKFAYISKKEELDNLDCSIDDVLGLFGPDSLVNVTDRPSLADMTAKAIDILSKGIHGFVLLIRGSQLNTKDPKEKAESQLNQIHELLNALAVAKNKTNENETLIVVTSSLANPIPVAVFDKDVDPGSGVISLTSTESHTTETGKKVITHHCHQYHYEGNNDNNAAEGPPRKTKSGGEDVVLFANGPWSHLFGGIYEQFNVPYFINYAACLQNENRDTLCNDYGLLSN